MTSPVMPQSSDQLQQQQLNQFTAERDAGAARILQMIGQAPAQTRPTVPQALQGQPVSADWHDDDLLGAAQFWGIPDEAARAMPRDHLVQVLNTLRSQARPSDQASSSLVNGFAAASMFGVGSAEAVTQGLRNLPVFGEALGRIDALHKADIWLKGLEEGVRASTPQSIQPVLTAEKWTGNLATLAVPAQVAWNVVGSLPLVGRMTPLVRGAVQGAGTAWLMDGGSEQFQADPTRALMFGAGLGAAAPLAIGAWKKLAPVLGAVQNRVTSAFVTPPPAPQVGAFGGDVEGLQQTATAEQQLPQTLGQQQQPLEGFSPSQPLASTEGLLPPLPQGFEMQGTPSAVAPTLRYPEGISVSGAAIPAQSPGSFAPFDPSIRNWKGIPQTVRRPAGFTINEATANSVGLTKAAVVMDSPALPELVKATEMNEGTVAKAAEATNPGGSNIVTGIGDPAAFAAQTDQHLSFASPRGESRLDALVSDTPLAAKQVAQYEVHGVYEGQSAVAPSGLEGSVRGISADGTATFKPTHGEAISLPVSQLRPSAISPAVQEAPGMWKAFQEYVDSRVGKYVGQMSGPLATDAQAETVRMQNIGHYTNEFLDEAKIVDPGERARLTSYFNQKYVESYKGMAPLETGAADSMMAKAQGMEPALGTEPLQALDQAAVVKGFTVIPEADGGITLQDRVPPQGAQPPVEVRFDSQDTAHEWLRNYGDRQLPDATPALSIPVEAIAAHPVSTGQLPNLNATIEEGLASSIKTLGEGEAEDASFKAYAQNLHEQASKLVGTGQLGRLQNLYINGLTNWSSMRKLFAAADEFSARAGLYDQGLTPFADYDKISQAVNLRANSEAPWLDRWQKISSMIDSRNKRSGLWSQVFLNPDADARYAQAVKAGLSQSEIAAFDETSSFFHEIFGTTGLAAEREIKGYLPMLQKMQSTGDFSAMDGWGGVNPYHTAFFEQVRRGAVNVREMNPDVLANAYIKSWSWQQAMDAPFSEVAEKWNAISKGVPELKPMADITQNWLTQIRYGYQDQADPILDAAHFMAQTFIGPNVSKLQTRQLINGALNWNYAGLMGYRPDLVARDLQQIWMAFPRAGNALPSLMQEFATGSAVQKAAIWNEALDDGMVNLIHPRSVSPGSSFGMEPGSLDVTATLPNTARQEALMRVSDAVKDMVPSWMHNPKLGPSYLYGLQGEAVRMISGIAGKRVAQEALTTFRAAGPAGELQALLTDSKATTYDPAISRQFQQLVASGQDNEAAAFMGRQLADASQFKYGPAESPINMRSVTGRLGAQLGSYPLYYTQYLGESLRNGSTLDKMKLAGTMGAVSAAFYAASKATGWNFNRMNPFTGFGFAGGPVLAQAGEVAHAITGTIDDMTGTQRGGGGGGNVPSIGQALGDVANTFNPVGGLIRTVGAEANALTGPSPLLGSIRVGLTGEPNAHADINNAMLPQADAVFQRSLQPIPSPVRVGQYGTLQIPQQVVTQPLEMGGTSREQILQGATGDYRDSLTQQFGNLSQQQHFDSAYAQLQRSGMPAETITHILGRRP